MRTREMRRGIVLLAIVGWTPTLQWSAIALPSAPARALRSAF
ncbi:MAG: hypothetical protein ABJC89_19515 [Acidobacteriota bacterium]